MSGYTKKMCQNEVEQTQTQFNNEIKSIIPILPLEYDFNTIKSLLEQYYPYELFLAHEKFLYYQAKEKSLKNRGKKSRYDFKTIDAFIKQSRIYKKIHSPEYKMIHTKQFDEMLHQKNVNRFNTKRNPKIIKTYDKIQKSIDKTQQMKPEYLDALIGLYNKKNTSQKDRVYIFKELEKYYNRKIINFFSKLVDTEYNRQLREMSCHHLQSLGFQPSLPKQKYIRLNTKNKKRRDYLKNIYAKETFKINQIPEELEYRINNSKEQKIKNYDFFLSHSSSDFNSVQSLIKILNKSNYNVYCDWRNDIDYLKRHLVGQETLNILESRLKQSKELIFIISDNSLKSKWCIHELNYFHELNKPIKFININDIHDNSFSYTAFDLNKLLNNRYREEIAKLFII